MISIIRNDEELAYVTRPVINEGNYYEVQESGRYNIRAQADGEECEIRDVKLRKGDRIRIALEIPFREGRFQPVCRFESKRTG